MLTSLHVLMSTPDVCRECHRIHSRPGFRCATLCMPGLVFCRRLNSIGLKNVQNLKCPTASLLISITSQRLLEQTQTVSGSCRRRVVSTTTGSVGNRLWDLMSFCDHNVQDKLRPLHECIQKSERAVVILARAICQWLSTDTCTVAHGTYSLRLITVDSDTYSIDSTSNNQAVFCVFVPGRRRGTTAHACANHDRTSPKMTLDPDRVGAPTRTLTANL